MPTWYANVSSKPPQPLLRKLSVTLKKYFLILLVIIVPISVIDQKIMSKFIGSISTKLFFTLSERIRLKKTKTSKLF